MSQSHSAYLRGILVMALSSVIFSAMSTFVKILPDDGSTVAKIALARFLFGTFLILGAGWLGLIRVRFVAKWLLVTRGVLGALAVYVYFISIAKVGLGKGSVLNFSYPIFAAVFATLFLRDRVRLDVWACVFLGFIGAYLIVMPDAARGAVRLNSYDLLALLGGVLAGGAVVAIKKLRETDSSYVIFLSQCFFGVLLVAGPASSGRVAFHGPEWVLLAALVVFAAIGQLLMTYAYKHVPATEGSLIALLTPAINMAVGISFFGKAEKMSVTAYFGCALILGSCAYVAIRKNGGAARPKTPS